MPPRSLVETALRVATDNVHLITSLGDMPDKFVSHILRAIKSPQQLKALEQVDEWISTETGPHWQRLIQRDFPQLLREHNWAPPQENMWSRIYDKYKEADEEAKRVATEALKAAMSANKAVSESKRARVIVTPNEVRNLPKAGPRQHWSRSTAARPPKAMAKGQNYFSQARREAWHDGQRVKSQAAGPSIPRKRATSLGRLRQAPQNMVDRKRIESQPAIRTARPTMMSSLELEVDRRRTEREERLMKMKNTRTQGPNVLSVEDLEELFSGDEAEPSASTSYSAQSPPAAAPSSPPKSKGRGLLSNAPGSNSRHLPATSPTRRATPSAGSSGSRRPQESSALMRPGKRPRLG
jgi:hypothetical protein